MAVGSKGTPSVDGKVLSFPKGNVREVLELLCRLAEKDEMAIFSGVLITKALIPGKTYLPMAWTPEAETLHVDMMVSSLEQLKIRYLAFLEELSGDTEGGA